MKKTFGENWNKYWNAWKTDSVFWEMLRAAQAGDTLYAPTTSLGSGKFHTSDIGFSFEGDSRLEQYQGYGPYRLTTSSGSDRYGYSLIDQHVEVHVLGERPMTWRQPLYSYTSNGPIAKDFDRVVSYENTGKIKFDLFAGDSTPWVVTTVIIGGGMKLADEMQLCQGSPYCAPIKSAVALAGAIWSGGTALNNATSFDYALTVSMVYNPQPAFKSNQPSLCPLQGCP